MSAGLFGYLRRNEPELVGCAQSGGAGYAARSAAPAAGARVAAGALWGALALVMLLTPLGILAGGTAWGEWAAKDFADPARRAEIATASGKVAPPVTAPAGVARLARVWTAPLPDYAPHLVKSAAFGYLLSAMFGVGLIVGVVWLLQRMTRRLMQPASPAARPGDAP